MVKNLIKETIYKNLNINPYDIFIKARGGKPQVLVGQLIDALFEYGNGPKAIQSLGFSPQTFNRGIKKLFPNITLSGGGENWLSFLIKNSDYKQCSNCQDFLLRNQFGNDSRSHDSLYRKCKACRVLSNKIWYDIKGKDYHKEYLINNRSDYNARNAKRRATLLQRTPRWANLEAIKEIYRICPKGYHVDHIIPLQGKFVSGLHVENNLQLLLAEDNMKKGNKFGGMA